MTHRDEVAALVLTPGEIEPIDPGTGVVTTPLVGAWVSDANQFTAGFNVFQPDAGIPLHTHNVEEVVFLVEGEGTMQLGDEDETVQVDAGQVVWVPPGTPHSLANRGATPMTAYCTYGGREVTRTLAATGETLAVMPADGHSSTSSR